MTFKVCPKCRSWRIQKVEGVIRLYRCPHCGWVETGLIMQGLQSFPSKQRLYPLHRSSWVYIILILIIIFGGGFLYSTMVITPDKEFAFLDKVPLFSEKRGTEGEIKPRSLTTEEPVILEPSTQAVPSLPEVSSLGEEGVSLHQPEKFHVVGNSKSKFYHLPGMKYYNEILSDRRIIFPSEEAAQQAGYRKAPR